MSIEPGQDLLHYQVVEKIGEGGMGVVWKALDTNLDRAVAIKFLSEPWSGEVDRLNRFEREAKLLASLNHPNIASVYGLHEADSARFIVMELVEGEDLDRRLARGALPIDEALGAAGRIARALEAAHEHGVIHRDLKPANTVLTPDGNVKVLDFGLAKAQNTQASSTSGPTSASLSPTLTSAGTVAGMILGTAAYLSPEQARGKPVDRRTDIWAFGCTLYEMLTGRRAFPGETLTDILAAVVHKEPDWSALPPGTPHAVRRLLERCLRKDPDRRLRDAGDVRVEIEDALDGGDRVSEPAAPTRSAWWKRTLPWAAAVLLGAALIVSLVGREEPGPRGKVRFTVDVPDEVLPQAFAMSPDGRTVAFVGTTPTGKTELWLRPFDEPEAGAVPDTEGAAFPFWAPDSKSLGFFQQGKLKRMEIESRTIRTVTDAPNGRGGTWNRDGVILFAAEGRGPLYRVPDSGGEPTVVTAFDAERDETSHRFPYFLPDGQRFTFLAIEGDDPGGTVWARSLDSDERTLLFADGFSEAQPTSDRFYRVQEGTLVSQRYDPATLRLDADIEPVVQSVSDGDPVWGRSSFSVSGDGALAYRASARLETELVSFDREGRRLGPTGQADRHDRPRISPDGTRVLFQRMRPGSESEGESWVADLTRGTLAQVGEWTSFGGSAWAADGASLLLVVDRTMYRMSLDGTETEEVLLEAQSTDDPSAPTVPGQLHVSADGSYVVFESWASQTSWDLWALPLLGEREPVSFVRTPDIQWGARPSPDGRLIAYESDESGQFQIYVHEYPSGGKWIISPSGGTSPRWSADGSELFYLSGSDIMAVPIERGNGFRAGAPRNLFRLPVRRPESFEVFPDGKRFLAVIPANADREPALTIVLDSR
jgi:Tol biopolymer transport system component